MTSRFVHRCRRTRARVFALGAAALAGLLLVPATASAETGAESEASTGAMVVDAATGRPNPEPVQLDSIRYLTVNLFGEVIRDEVVDLRRAQVLQNLPAATPDPRGGDCQFSSSHSTPPFNSGQFNAQAGFAENEWAIQSFTIPANQFPVQINAVEILFVTSQTIETTTTEWSFGVWTGTPNNGTLEYLFSSDDIILPHLTMPPGNNGTLLSVQVDPADPEQIVLTNNGTNAFSFGFRVDEHNAQTGTGCGGSSQIPSNRNAFPATDTDGLASPSGNWLGAIDCGLFGCPPGFNPFSALGFCQPSGDWAMNVVWTTLSCAPGSGACCDPATGNCSIQTQAGCDAINGTYQGDDTTCQDVDCPDPTVACCFAGTGGCLNLSVADCMALNGVPGDAGSTCATTVCFPEGACCLEDGSCVDGLSPEDCAILNGTFQGDGTTCATVDCPEPTGACCVGDNCLELTEGDCGIVGGDWAGAGTTCDDCAACPADWNGDELVNILDVVDFINDWNDALSFTDINNDGEINILDVADFIALWNKGC